MTVMVDTGWNLKSFLNDMENFIQLHIPNHKKCELCKYASVHIIKMQCLVLSSLYTSVQYANILES